MNEDCFNIQHMIAKAARTSVGGYLSLHTSCAVLVWKLTRTFHTCGTCARYVEMPIQNFHM